MLTHHMPTYLSVGSSQKKFYTGCLTLCFFVLLTFLLPTRTLYAAADITSANDCDLAVEIIAAPYAVVDSS